MWLWPQKETAFPSGRSVELCVLSTRGAGKNIGAETEVSQKSQQVRDGESHTSPACPCSWVQKLHFAQEHPQMCQGLSTFLHLFPALSFLNSLVLMPVSGQQASTWLAHFLGCSETPPYQVLQLCGLPAFSPVSISFQPKSYSTTRFSG